MSDREQILTQAISHIVTADIALRSIRQQRGNKAAEDVRRSAVREFNQAIEQARALLAEGRPQREAEVERIWSVMAIINERMHPGSACPGAGALGECAAISTLHGHSGARFYQAHLYLWPAADALQPSTVAEWFKEAGCHSITVAAVIHDPDNEVADGVAHDQARPWDVSFLLSPASAAPSEIPR